MKRIISRITSYLLIPIFLLGAIIVLPTDVYAATNNINPYNAIGITVGSTNEDGSVTDGKDLWYVFSAPQGNCWVITRITGTHDAGILQVSIYDEQLNLIKENYTHSGNHIAEIVCRMHYEGVGSKEDFIPRLMADGVYYIRVRGTGKFNLNCDRFDDDYRGDYESATSLSVGTTISGRLERDEDIDSFYFDVPSSYSYKVTVSATKKMDVDIADKNEYVLNNNSLRVLRDNSTAEYTVSGSGIRRYFFLYGKGGTYYKINVSIDTDASKLGLWTKVTANKGSKTIKIKTQKGAKISIIVKSAKGKKKLYIKYKKKKKKRLSVTQTKATQTYKLSRKLKKGDVIIVTATKKRYKEFNYKKTVK